MAGFADATTVRATAAGAYEIDLDPQWTVGGRPNGGYLLAAMARAAVGDSLTHPHPVAASAQYVTGPDVGPATITVEALRTGRLASQVRARLSQKERVCVEALFTLARLEADADPIFVDAQPPELTPIGECARSPLEPPGAGIRVEMLEMVDQRLDMAHFTRGSGSIQGWLTFDDGSLADPFSLLYVADSFPPATFTLGSVGWVPTLELTVYVRGVPAPGPLRVRQRARVLTGSLVDQVCEVWDSTGRVVAQATQLAAVRMS